MTPLERERRFRRIKEIGCIVARRKGLWMLPEIHHQNFNAHAGGKRLGDEFTIGLNRWSHRGVPPDGMTAAEARVLLGPSLAREPNQFRAEFGSDETLLAFQNRLIAEREQLANSAARSPSLKSGAVPTTAGDVAADLEGTG